MATSSIRDNSDDQGFATALAMAVSLAITMAVAALLIRSEVDLLAARGALERTRAEYRLDAIQAMAAREFRADTTGLKLHRIEFDNASASVQGQDEAGKISPWAAAGISDSWMQSLGVTQPAALKAELVQRPRNQPLTLQALADLAPSPFWKACAADAISAEGGRPSAVGAATPLPILPVPIRHLRLIAMADDGWVDDRIVRLTNDPANPVTVLNRRFYRRSGPGPACPTPPEPQGAA